MSGRPRRSAGSRSSSRRSSAIASGAGGAVRVLARGDHGAVDHLEVHALGDDRVPFGARGDVDADELAHVALQLGAGEQHGVRGVRGEALHESCAEPEVLAQIGLAEGLPRQRTRPVERADDGVRVGRHREHGRDAELARDVGGGEAADVGHPQVQQVDGAGGAQDATDAATRGDPQRPGRRRRDRLRKEWHAAVDVPRGLGSDLEEVFGCLGDRAARQGDHALDARARVGDEGVAEAHQERGDPAVVARPHRRERRIDVGVQEQLADREAVGPRDMRVRHRVEVDQGEACDLGEPAVAAHELFECIAHARDTGALPQSGDGRDPRVVAVTVVAGDLQQQARRDLGAHQAERLDEPCARGRVAGRLKCGLEADGERVGGRGRPLLERALCQHAGEAARGHLPDETAHRVGTGESRGERPCGVLADRRPIVREQRGQHPCRLLVEDPRERVHPGDRGDLIVAVECRGDHPERAHTGVAPGLEREVFGEADGLDDSGGVAHRIQRRLHAHLASPRSSPRCGRRTNRSPPREGRGWASVNGFTPIS